MACTRARDHLLLSGSLASEHFAEHDLETAPDCLFWLCRSLNITEADLDRVSKAVEGLEWPVRIYTYTESFPTAICQNQLSAPAFRALLQEPAPTVNPTSGPLVFLTPLQDPHFLPKFTVAELTLFAANPESHYQQHKLGLPPWAPHLVDTPERRALLFGELAHRARSVEPAPRQ